MSNEEQLDGFNYMIERVDNGFIVVFLRKIGTIGGQIGVKQMKIYAADIQVAIETILSEEQRLNPSTIISTTEH